MLSVDLNADVGEGCGDDASILACVSSANIACGGHAGDAARMLVTVRSAMDFGVAIGAHPGYPDREHFGRRELAMPISALQRSLRDQLCALSTIVRAHGGRLAHIKPHGALYNQAARDAELASSVLDVFESFDATLAIVGLSGGELTRQARARGLKTVEEVFADRAYQADGSLAPRGTPGAVIEDIDAAIAQTLELVRHGQAQALDGSVVPLTADSVCLHGDGAHALELAQRLRAALLDNGVAIRAA